MEKKQFSTEAEAKIFAEKFGIEDAEFIQEIEKMVLLAVRYGRKAERDLIIQKFMLVIK